MHLSNILHTCLAHGGLQEFKKQKESILSGEFKIILIFYLKKLQGKSEDCHTC